MNNQVIWIDGVYKNSDTVGLSPLTQTLHYGFGVFEGIRSYQTDKGPAIFRLKSHLDRLFQSADTLKLKIPFTKNVLMEVHHEIIKKNNIPSAYLRPLVFMGDEYLGLHTDHSSVHVMVMAIPWHQAFTADKKGISVMTVSQQRMALQNGLNQAKANGLYVFSLLANNEARAAGYDDALLLDPHHFIAEGAGANLFYLKNNELFTPIARYCLNGITRRTVIDIAIANNMPVTEKDITLDELYQADEVFFTGTAVEILPITKIDQHFISSGCVGHWTEKFQKHYHDIVTAQDSHYLNWLSFVDKGVVHVT